MTYQTLQKPIKSRYIGIDVYKGWGVWFMFLIHAFVQQITHFDAGLFIPTIERTVGWRKIVLLIFGLPIGVMAIWGFMFGFAFACTVAMQTMHLIDTDPKKFPKYLLNKFLTGALILLLNKIGHALFRIRFFTDGETIFPRLSVSYSADILDAVAWMGVIIPLLIWIVYKLIRVKKPMQLLIVFGVLLTMLFALTPTLIKLGESAIVWLEARNLYIPKLLITKFIRGRFRLLPGLGYGLMGCMYATMLHHKWEIKKIFRFTLSFFIYCMMGFVIWWLLIDPNWFSSFAEETVPIPLTIVSMSTMQFLFVLFIRTQDYPRNELKRVRAARRTTFWRRYSLFSLTAFSINTGVEDRIYTVFARFWGESVDYSSSPGIITWNVWQCIIFVLFIWAFWEVVLRIWEHYDYKLSLDWFLVQLMVLITGAKMGRSAIKPIIYGPNRYRMQELVPAARKVKVIN
ncbi:MAG: hypothetical protein JW776_11775 [Candidatus Lokiarchaeota archaeon]|nr:hypothetical protein [Candidatus Lokiarchaeota archaeon]